MARVAGWFVAVALPSGLASAQTDTLAESLFRDARVAMKADDPGRACPLFAESYRLDPAHGTLFNLAVCEEVRGRLASAWAAFSKLVDVAPADDERVIEARSRLRALETRVPRLRIVVAHPMPPDHTLELDGVALGPGALEELLRVDPGKHALRVTARGKLVRSTQIELAVGQRLTHSLEPISVPRHSESPAVGASPPLAATHTPKTRPTESSATRYAAYTAFGLGGAGVGASLVLGALAMKARDVTEDRCPNRLCDPEGMAAGERGTNYASLATAGATAGLVGLAAGALLLWRASDESIEVGLVGEKVRLKGTF